MADVYLRWKIGPKVDIFALGPGAKGAKASGLVKAIAHRFHLFKCFAHHASPVWTVTAILDYKF